MSTIQDPSGAVQFLVSGGEARAATLSGRGPNMRDTGHRDNGNIGSQLYPHRPLASGGFSARGLKDRIKKQTWNEETMRSASDVWRKDWENSSATSL